MKPSTVLCSECDRPVADSVPLCDVCTDEFVSELKTVPGIVADITITAARLARMSNGRNGGKSAETLLPIQITGKVGVKTATDDQLPHRRPYDALVNSLTTWGRHIEDHYRLTIPIEAAGLRGLVMANRCNTGRRDKAAFALSSCTEAECVAIWLACNPQSIRLMPASHEMVADISNAIDRARMAVDRAPELRYLGPCPGVLQSGKPCEFELRAESGEQWVRCGRCREQHNIDKIMADAQRRIEDRLCTMKQIAGYLGAMGYKIPTSTLHNWNNRPPRWLIKRGWLHGNTITTAWIHRDDPPVYRFGDVLRAVRRELTVAVDA